MAKKISQLTTGTTPTGTELIEVVQGGNSRKITAQQIADLASGGVNSVIDWDLSTNTVPTGYSNGQRFYGTGTTSLTTGTGGVIPTEVFFTQIVDTPTDTSGFVFQYVI